MKRFFLGTLLVLVSFGGCKKNEAIQPLTSSQKEAFNYLPAESRFVMYVNLNELRKTEFWGGYFKSPILENKLDNKWFYKFESKTGIGLNDGISQVFFSSGRDFNIAVIVFNKNFKKVRNYFEDKDNFIKESFGDKTVYKAKEKLTIQFYFVNDSTLLTANNFNNIESVLSGKSSLIKNKDLLSGLINSIKYKRQYWIATDEGMAAVNYIKNFIDFNDKIPVKHILKSVKGITLSIQLNGEVNIESCWNCNDSRNAYLLSTAIKGALALDLLSDGNYSISRILQKTEVERTNSQINLQLELKGDDITALKDFAKQINVERKL